MDFLVFFSLSQWIVIAAISLLCLMLGALFNQKKTRARWLAMTEHTQREHQQQLSQLQQELEQADSQLDTIQQQCQQQRYQLDSLLSELGSQTAKAEQVSHLAKTLVEKEHKLDEIRLSLSKQYAENQKLTAQHHAEQQALNDKIALLENAELRLKGQFEQLAHRIFEERSDKLTEQNTTHIGHILAPLKQQLEGFRQQINASYQHEQNERSALKHELNQLARLNVKMSQDAINLTRALKGDNKQQGNWGEVILERVLSESGLREGHEYHTQADLKNEHGQRFKPDVIVHLPQDKDIVIDAKMSLVAYERYYNSEDAAEQQQALKDHLLSMRQHIRGLSQKDYQLLHGIKTLDYVLMFIPVEPAFLLALDKEPSIINFALDHNIMLVSPTNLLVALRTIQNIWRYEYQNQHAQQIAKQAGRIHDKLCGYVEEMDKLGRTLDTAQKSYQNAMSKLATGKGNLIRQAHQMQQLGVDTSKQLDRQLLEQALNQANEQ
ncbi:DNA recombination protein RmuC [Shewanella sp. NIFS-20-20]|uniref:DNA recombination protein RmuC n=1 Tax=Shewanella sp. NIFS-20-20 TaxID=2853806 RepID=UPI001C438BAD|nr:DNA recombination protein RmuC [Shewanella sp. NIFS-20-20]MBV7315073.1 DNA recombination protein RmuC [Shewanella sp. NIFS-20-20]